MLPFFLQGYEKISSRVLFSFGILPKAPHDENGRSQVVLILFCLLKAGTFGESLVVVWVLGSSRLLLCRNKRRRQVSCQPVFIVYVRVRKPGDVTGAALPEILAKEEEKYCPSGDYAPTGIIAIAALITGHPVLVKEIYALALLGWTKTVHQLIKIFRHTNIHILTYTWLDKNHPPAHQIF